MERSQVAPLLKETPLSHRPAQEHLAGGLCPVAGWPVPCSPQGWRHMAALAHPATHHAKSSSPSAHTHREASCLDTWMQFWAALDACLASRLRNSIGPREEHSLLSHKELDPRNCISTE